MKKGIHPESYRLVVFKDMSNDYSFVTRSTTPTKETIVWEDGNEYPLVKVEISHMSHPFYTGKSMFVDTAGLIRYRVQGPINSSQVDTGLRVILPSH